jgi:predicted permease
MLLKHKGFASVAVLSLALGIGANTALFSVVDAVLLKTLSVREPEQLVLFGWQSGRAFRTNGMRGSFVPGPPGTRVASMFRYDIIERLQKAHAESPNTPLTDLFSFAPIYELTAVKGDQADIVNGQAVSGGYFNGVGVTMLLGRGITDADDRAGAPPVVVLSHDYWEEKFAADPQAIGQPLKINGTSFTVIGVTPASFTSTLQVGQRPEVTVPIAFEPTLLGERTGMAKKERPHIWWIGLMGRLKPGATMEQARESLNGTFQAAALEFMPPPRKENEPAKIEEKDYPRLTAQTGSRGLMESRSRYSSTIYGLFIIVAVVLLIACANVANLLLARAALRSSEIGVRLAVGAGRWRLIRQLLTESVLLAGVGGALGVFFAIWGNRALAALADRDTGFLPSEVEPGLNLRVLAFTVGVSVLTGILFGLAPAWRATSVDLTKSLKQSRRSTGSVSRLSKSLVVIQVALSLMLLVGAGLFIRTLYNLQQVNLGFNQENLLLFSLQPGQGGYQDERLIQFYQQLFTRLDSLPGVRAATFGRVPLISHFTWNTNVLLPGETEKTAEQHLANRQMVRENYFSTLEIPLLSGRAFTAQDTPQAPKVAIVNKEFGRKYFPNEDVVGKRVTDSDGNRQYEIIGVVADTKYNSQRSELEPLLYTPWQQEIASIGEMYFSLRTSGEPTALSAAIRQAVKEQDSNLPLKEIDSQTSRSQRSLGQERLYARLLSFFGALALLLAAIGLSGVLSYSVAQRTNEIGVRMALGAQLSNVLRLVIWQGMKLVLIGLAVGALGGYALTRYMRSQSFARGSWQRQMADQLYGVSGTDPMTFIIIAITLTLVALLACWVPARRATKVDPMIALRCD